MAHSLDLRYDKLPFLIYHRDSITDVDSVSSEAFFHFDYLASLTCGWKALLHPLPPRVGCQFAVEKVFKEFSGSLGTYLLRR